MLRILTNTVLVTVTLFCALTPSRADDKSTCPVTKSTPISFNPPLAFTGHQEKLFGTEKLFTVFPGNWHYTQQSERGYRIPKIVWGSAVFDLSEEKQQSALTITGHRLDAPSGPLQFDRASTAWTDQGYFITSGFYVPTLGCWEVTGHFHGNELKIVVDLK